MQERIKPAQLAAGIVLLAVSLTAFGEAAEDPEPFPGESEYAERAERLLAAAIEAGDDLGTAQAQYLLAQHMKALRLWPQSLTHARLAREAAELADDENMRVAADIAYGASLGQLSRAAEAIEILLPSLKRARTLENVEQQLWALLALDTAYFHAQQLEQAEDYAHQGLGLARANGDHTHTARFLSNLGLIAYTRGDLVTAEAFIQEALTIDDLPPDIQRTLTIASISLASATDTDTTAHAREAIAAARHAGNTFHEGFATAQLGEILCNNGELQEAARAFEAADSMLREGDSLTDLQSMYEVWAECLERAGEFENALAHQREAKALLEQAHGRRQDEIRQGHEIAFRTEQRLAELARLTAEEQSLQARVARQRAFTGWATAGGLLLLLMAAGFWVRSHRLRQQRDAQQALQQARIDLLARTSHEIRNPAQGIIGILEGRITSHPRLADDRQLAAALSAARMVGHLSNDYLDLALLEQGKLEIDSDALCHVPSLAEQVEALSHAFIKSPDQTLTSHIGENVPAWVHADGARLTQVLLNLISNAAYYGEAGEITLAISADAQSKHLRFEITDCGPGFGIAGTVSFDPYVRGDQGESNPRGSGLGLAVCARIMDAMGGNITARNRSGGGAALAVALPLRAAREAPATGDQPVPAAPTEAVSRRVLIVDDDPFSRLGLKTLAESAGAQVRELSSGTGLEQALRTFDPEIILLDYRLGSETGIELATRIRELDENGPDSRFIVIISGSGNEAEEGTDVIDRWLIKPLGRTAISDLMQYTRTL